MDVYVRMFARPEVELAPVFVGIDEAHNASGVRIVGSQLRPNGELGGPAELFGLCNAALVPVGIVASGSLAIDFNLCSTP